MLSAIKAYLIPPKDDPDEIRKRGLIQILARGLLALSLLAFLAMAVYLALNPDEWHSADNPLALASAAIAFVVSVGIYQANKTSSRISSFLLLLLLVVVPVFSDTPDQVANGRSLFLFMLPIAISSLILLPPASFLFATLSSIMVVVLSLSIDIFPNMPAMIGFFMLAFGPQPGADTVRTTRYQCKPRSGRYGTHTGLGRITGT
jgi:hypothetical protein